MTPLSGRPRPASLFPDGSLDLIKGLAQLPDILKRIQPMKEKHRKALASGVRGLSSLLTVERDNLPPDYMTRPEYMSAYLHYFLPWNIYRQGRLLQGLDFSLKEGSTVFDFGAGPLTFLQSMWLTRPHMRSNNYQYIGFDRSEPGLKVGRKLYEEFAGDKAGKWKVNIERQLGAARKYGQADFIVAANFINELNPPRAAAIGEATAEDLLIQRWDALLKPDAAILVIEPGTRASAKQLVRLRQAALATGWRVDSPCSHAQECAMPGSRGGPWCHFNFIPRDIPEWLFQFSRKVKLPKDRASLSFLLLKRGDNCPVRTVKAPTPSGGDGLVRVISETFDLPENNLGRYGCGAKGLVLLKSPQTSIPGPQPGDLLTVKWPDNERRDTKSKAIIVDASE